MEVEATGSVDGSSVPVIWPYTTKTSNAASHPPTEAAIIFVRLLFAAFLVSASTWAILN